MTDNNCSSSLHYHEIVFTIYNNNKNFTKCDLCFENPSFWAPLPKTIIITVYSFFLHSGLLFTLSTNGWMSISCKINKRWKSIFRVRIIFSSGFNWNLWFHCQKSAVSSEGHLNYIKFSRMTISFIIMIVSIVRIHGSWSNGTFVSPMDNVIIIENVICNPNESKNPSKWVSKPNCWVLFQSVFGQFSKPCQKRKPKQTA